MRRSGVRSPSAPPIESTTYSHQLWWLFLFCDAIVTGHLEIKQHRFNSGTFVALSPSHVPSCHTNIRVAHKLGNRESVVTCLAETGAECRSQIMPAEPHDETVSPQEREDLLEALDE